MFQKPQTDKRTPQRLFTRLALAAAVSAAAVLLCAQLMPRSHSATPAAGAISESSPRVTWTGAFKAPTGSADCGGANNAGCENFKLTITPPSASYGPYLVEVRLQPELAGDWDMQVYGPTGALVDGSGNSPGQGELVVLMSPPAGTYTVSAAPFAPVVGADGSSFSASAEIKHHFINSAQQGPDTNVSYQNFSAPAGLGDTAGEPTVGVNWNTGRAMFIANRQTLRITFDDSTVPSKAAWENKSFALTGAATMDPILFTDPQTGRTIVSQLVTPAAVQSLLVLTDACSISAYTDDDGETWVPNQGCGLPSGADHQSIGGGPFHAPLPASLAAPDAARGYTHATYYCAQSGVTAYCSRSDDGGLTYGPGVPIYTTECGGLHGHPIVGADGTVYVPNKNCGGRQGVAVSEDNGITWTVRAVPDTLGGAVDPGVGVGSGGTVYLGYQNGDGRPSVAVSRDRGVSWSKPVDVGAAYGIKNTVFPRVVAGDDDRAAFAFLGTPTAGSFQASTFTGEWHLYVSHTYDGGRTWTTIDATPTDPVQRGCIWMQGGSNPCRNLLDFMGSAIDKEGRVIVGYADGCVGCTGPSDSRKRKATIARQVNGRRLFSKYDRPEAPVLSASADADNPSLAHLSWTRPDDNGTPVSGYNVYRSTGGPFAQIATVPAGTNTYDDTRDPSVATYYKVAAVNQWGEGAPSNVATVAAAPQPPPTVITPVYQKGGIAFSPNTACRAPVATRDGEPSLRVDKFGNAYAAGIRGVPAGVDLWYFDLRPTVNGQPNPTYDPLMRNPIYRGQPDQFSPDEAVEVGADGGGDVDLAVGFDDTDEGAPPKLAFTSLKIANLSAARSEDRGATFLKNTLGSATGGVPVDDRQWLEFYGKDKVYMLYRTFQPAVTQIQRSEDGGLTYGPAVTAGTIGQVGSIDVDQYDGTVYVSGSNGVVATGIPPAPGLMPVTFTNRQVATNAANLFFVVKVADDKLPDGTHLGTVYVTYSNGRDVFIKYSRDKGATWSQAIRVSDGPETRTSLLPWIETGPLPGSVGVVWYGTDAAANGDDARWKVFFAQSTNALSASPVFRQVQASDHVVHGANISLGGTLGNANRNLLDYFQIAFDPTGAAVIAYTDDHNDFDGHTYVARQISGPGVNGSDVPAPAEGAALPPPPAPPAPGAPQVVDFAQDGRYGLLTVLPVNSPLVILSVRYSTEDSAAGPVLVAQMKVSDLSVVPALANWRMHFTANAPDSRASAYGDYSFGISDDGDQFFLMANTDTGTPAYSFGTATRQSTGQLAYTVRGAADSGSFDTANGTVTVKCALSKLNPFVRAGNAALAPGTVLTGLRGGAFTTGDDNAAGRNDRAQSDYTRGGSQYTIALAGYTARSGGSASAPAALNFDALAEALPALDQSGMRARLLPLLGLTLRTRHGG